MYSYISGELVEITEDYIVVDNHGIGYRFFVPKSTAFYGSAIGEQIRVYTFLHVREDAIQMFGFATKEELEIFKLLIGVNGIGPKGALAILGILSVSDFRFAILMEDAKAIAAAPGIGAKTAQRVILDLKDKVDQMIVSDKATEARSVSVVKNEVLEALTSLGYSSTEALRAMEGVDFDESSRVEVVLKDVLKKMSFL